MHEDILLVIPITGNVVPMFFVRHPDDTMPEDTDEHIREKFGTLRDLHNLHGSPVR